MWQSFERHSSACVHVLVEQLKDHDKRLLANVHAALRAMVPMSMSLPLFVAAVSPQLAPTYKLSVKGKVEILGAILQVCVCLLMPLIGRYTACFIARENKVGCRCEGV